MKNNDLKIPQHVAFIVDGNRRWAKKRMLPTLEGHRRGADNLEHIFEAAREFGTKVVTAWLFSTENWKRSESEVNYLFDLLREFIVKYKEKFLKEKTGFRHIGRKDRLPEDVINLINELEEETAQFTDYTVCLALDYGGHDELVRTFQKLKEKDLEINEKNIEANLDTAGLPNIDMIIRTGGEQRLSGFLSWQSHYAEFYFPKVTFPAFTKEHFTEIYEDFSKRDRRFGGDTKDKSKYLKK